MKTTSYVLAFTLLITPILVKSQIIHVPADQPAIQVAINAANEHDTVLVDQGEYFENINFMGKKIVVCSNFILSNDSADLINTIINGSMPMFADTGSCVLIVSGEDSTAVLAGFTITGGTGTRWEDEHGLNHWYTEGGGILIQYASPTIKNNIITGNEAINKPAGTTSAGGGAIRCGDGNPHILNNIITNNQGRYGGGIVMNYSGAVIKNNLIAGNTGGEDYGGGGLWFLSNGDKPLIFENNTIVNNNSALGGGGIRLWSCVATITNNIFWGNTASSNAQIQGNGGIITYCCIEAGYPGEGNTDTDPLFMGVSFILSDNSPCIDAGNPDVSFNDPEDQQNPGEAMFPAQGTTTNDMGLYGGPGCCQYNAVLTGFGIRNFDQDEFNVSLYPNPVHSAIKMRIISQREAKVELQIFDTHGALIRDMGLYSISENNTNIVADISEIESGTYFLKLTSQKVSHSFRFIKI